MSKTKDMLLNHPFLRDNGANLSHQYDLALLFLQDSGFDHPNLSQIIKWVLAHILNCPAADLSFRLSRARQDGLQGAGQAIHILTSNQIEQFRCFISMIASGTPLSRVLGEQEFWGLRFKVNDHMLDPRPDTELIPEIVLKRFDKSFAGMFLDLGTGSGCISQAILSEYPESYAIAIDKSPQAIAGACANAVLNKLEKRFFGICGDWYESLSPDTRFPLIVTNPPYIPSGVILNLDENVKNYDPILALDGGDDGFDSIKQIISSLKKHLLPGGICLMELGYDQAQETSEIVEKAGLSVADVHHDLAGIPRVVEILNGDK